jgi:hypothetical protein
MEDVRDTALGAALDRVVSDVTPSGDIGAVKRRGGTRRSLQRLIVVGSVVLFVAVVAFAATEVGSDAERQMRPLSTFTSNETPWTFTYPEGWIATSSRVAGPSASRKTDVTETFVSNAQLPPDWTSGPNSTPLPSTVPSDAVIVLIERLWLPGAGIGSAPTLGAAFHDDAQNPGWSFNETARCEGTLCFHVVQWFGPDASQVDRQVAAQIAAAVAPAHPASRWTETDGVQTVLHDEANGYVVTVPNEGWQVADQNLTPWLSAPTEILSAGTSALPVSKNPDDGLRPFDAPVAPAALAAMTSTDAFISLQEAVPVGAPHDDRPTSFRTAPARACCSEQAGDYPFTWWWFPFIDQGRAFYLFVAIGNDATTATVDQTWSAADSLSFVPGPTGSASEPPSTSPAG